MAYKIEELVRTHDCQCPPYTPKYEKQPEQEVAARLTEEFMKNTKDELLEKAVNAIQEAVGADARQKRNQRAGRLAGDCWST